MTFSCVLLTRWVFLMRDASMLILKCQKHLLCSRVMSDSRSNVVDHHSNAKAVFTSEDMLEKSCFACSLGMIRKDLMSDSADHTKNPDRSVTGNAFGGRLGFLIPLLLAPLTLVFAMLDAEKKGWDNVVKRRHKGQQKKDCYGNQEGEIFALKARYFYSFLTYTRHHPCSSRCDPWRPSRWDCISTLMTTWMTWLATIDERTSSRL